MRSISVPGCNSTVCEELQERFEGFSSPVVFSTQQTFFSQKVNSLNGPISAGRDLRLALIEANGANIMAKKNKI